MQNGKKRRKNFQNQPKSAKIKGKTRLISKDKFLIYITLSTHLSITSDRADNVNVWARLDETLLHAQPANHLDKTSSPRSDRRSASKLLKRTADKLSVLASLHLKFYIKNNWNRRSMYIYIHASSNMLYTGVIWFLRKSLYANNVLCKGPRFFLFLIHIDMIDYVDIIRLKRKLHLYISISSLWSCLSLYLNAHKSRNLQFERSRLAEVPLYPSFTGNSFIFIRTLTKFLMLIK